MILIPDFPDPTDPSAKLTAFADPAMVTIDLRLKRVVVTFDVYRSPAAAGAGAHPVRRVGVPIDQEDLYAADRKKAGKPPLPVFADVCGPGSPLYQAVKAAVQVYVPKTDTFPGATAAP